MAKDFLLLIPNNVLEVYKIKLFGFIGNGNFIFRIFFFYSLIMYFSVITLICYNSLGRTCAVFFKVKNYVLVLERETICYSIFHNFFLEEVGKRIHVVVYPRGNNCFVNSFLRMWLQILLFHLLYCGLTMCIKD